MNLDPAIWGPHAWFFLDSVLIGMPEYPTDDEKLAYKSLFYSLIHILPCEKCRQHYFENISDSPLTDEILSSKNDTIEWIVNFHNKVREKLNKNPQTISEFLNYYKSKYDKKDNKCSDNIYIYVSIICVLVILVIYLYSKN